MLRDCNLCDLTTLRETFILLQLVRFSENLMSLGKPSLLVSSVCLFSGLCFGQQVLHPVVITSGSLTAIDAAVAINNEGLIAFTGRDTDGSKVFVATAPSTYRAVSFWNSNRTFQGVGISSGASPAISARDLVSGSPPAYLLRKWDVNTGGYTLIGSSPSNFDSVITLCDINDSGVVSGVALIGGSTSTALVAGATSPPTQLAVYSGAQSIRPQIANTGDVVIRDNIGRIISWNYPSGAATVYAGSTTGFDSTTGRRPGISKDGAIVGFTGNRGFGPGVFVSIPDGAGGRTIRAIAGEGDSFTGFFDEQRVGVCDTLVNSTDRIVQVVFAGIKNGVTGVYTASVTSTGGIVTVSTPVKLLAVGDSVSGVPGTVTGFTLYNAINANGIIAFSATFSGGQTAILETSAYGIDVSKYTNLLSPTTWNQLRGNGWGYAVVGGFAGHGSSSDFTNNLAHDQVMNARTAGLGVGTYCFLNFDNGSLLTGAPANQTGGWQIQQTFRLLGDQAAYVSFVAIDIEAGYMGTMSVAQRMARIREARQAIVDAGLRPIVYTSRTGWTSLTANNLDADIAALPLWDIKWEDPTPPNLANFTPYGGWLQRLAQQWGYDNGSTKSQTADQLETQYGISSLDVDVFDPSLFAAQAAPLIPIVVASPASFKVGAQSTGSILLSGPLPAGAVTVSLSSSTAGVTVPASVTVPSGSRNALFTITASAAAVGQQTITASVNGIKTTAVITIKSAPSSAPPPF